MSTDTAVDLVVIGLGPGGEHLATEAAKAGLTVVGIDERLVGGECPYCGCIPSKMVIRAANLLADARRVGTLAGTAEATPDWGVVARPDPRRGHRRLGRHGRGRAPREGRGAVRARPRAARRHRRGRGRRHPRTRPRAAWCSTPAPRRPLPRSTGWPTPRSGPTATCSATPDLPASMVVIGGGAIGAELAQAFARFGTKVSLVEAAPRILALEEPESSDVVARAMAADGIQVLAGATIASVRHADGRFTVSLTDAGGTALELGSDRLLVAAGRRPNIADVGLDTVGLDPAARSVDTDARMRAGDRLWAIGDITGKGAFTHMSMYQAAVALADITGRSGDDAREAEYHAVPRVTFTDPEVGAVGMTEKQARDAGLDVAVGLAPLAESTRGWITGPGGEGRHQARRGPRRGPPRRRHVGRADGRRGALDARHRGARPGAHRHAGPDAVRLPDLPPRRRDGAGGPAGVAVDAAGRVRAAMAAQPRERFLPAPSGGGRRTTARSTSATARPTASRARCARCSSCSTCGPGSGCSTSGRGRAGRPRCSPSSSGPTGLGARASSGCPTSWRAGAPNVEAARMPWARVRAAVTGVLGAPDEAPFDRVLVSAMARRLPEELLAQLGGHGILVVPVAGRMLRVERDDEAPDGRRITEHGHYRFVPLVTD